MIVEDHDRPGLVRIPHLIAESGGAALNGEACPELQWAHAGQVEAHQPNWKTST